MESGFVVASEEAFADSAVLRMRDNYLTLNGRPLFLFGTDSYARTYLSAAENPKTWDRELATARDMGMNLYENLQYTGANHHLGDEDWRKFRAMAQLTQQRQLFMAVAHYALGLGCSKVQNWCLHDAQNRVFPWGMFYPNQLVAKDVAYVHRNLSMLWRHLAPRYEPPGVVVALPSHMRLGNDADIGAEVAYRVFSDLLTLHLPFGCIEDEHFDALSPATRVVIFPSPFALSDSAFEQMLSWVERGGTLLVTGDIAYDTNRQRTRVDRMVRLAGVESTRVRYANISRHKGVDHRGRFDFLATDSLAAGSVSVRPCVDIKVQDAEVLGRDDRGGAILVRHPLGQGTVYYCSDPLELTDAAAARSLRRALYRAVVQKAGVEPTVTTDVPWFHVMPQPTRTGSVYVVYNTRTGAGAEEIAVPTAAGDVRLKVRNRWPAAVMTNHQGAVLLVNAYGYAAAPATSAVGSVIFQGQCQIGMVSLDGVDLRSSRALLIAPFEPGWVELAGRASDWRAGDWVAVMGESVAGRWKSYAERSLAGAAPKLRIDRDDATLLILICPRGEREHWEAYLSTMFATPSQVPGY